MAQCRFCKVESDELNKDGICPHCENEVGVTAYREHSRLSCFLALVVIAGIVVGAWFGIFWLFSHFPTLLWVSHE